MNAEHDILIEQAQRERYFTERFCRFHLVETIPRHDENVVA